MIKYEKFSVLLMLLMVGSMLTARVQTALGAGEIVIVSPTDEQYFDACSDIKFVLDPQIDDSQVQSISLKANHGAITIRNFTKPPWEYTYKSMVSGYYDLVATLRDKSGNIYDSTPIQILVGTAERGEVIANGGFDCRLYPWSWGNWNGAVATCEVMDDNYFNDQNYALVTITALGDNNNDYNIQLSQTCPVDKGHTYQFSFMADSDAPKTISIEVQINHDPWNIYWMQSVDIKGWNLYGPWQWTSDTTDYTCAYRMNLGGNTIGMMIDEIRIIDLNHTGVDSRDQATRSVEAYQLYQNYPNPFNMNTTIQYDIPKKAFVEMAVYNIQGQKVRSLVDGVQTAGAYSIGWDGTDDSRNIVPSGMYFYKMTSRSSDGVQTVSKKLLLIK